jgi:hypothetical protein
MPALRRYAGTLYKALTDDVRATLEQAPHVVIISGGYGAVLANEPIGWYDARFNPAWWPHRLVPRCLAAYAKTHQLNAVVAFAGGSTPYAKVVRAAPWAECGLEKACLLTPLVQGGAMRRTPQALGQSLAAFRVGNLSSRWASTDGARFDAIDLLA